MSYENHASKGFRKEVEQTAKRAPTPDEVATYKRWEKDGRIKVQNDANEAAEK